MLARSRRGRVSRGRRIIDLVLLALLIVIAGFVRHGRVPAERIAQEKARLATVAGFLEKLCAAERSARERKLVDEDRDGQGEFLFLSELVGARPCRGSTSTGTEVLLEAPFDRRSGFATVAGYHVTIYLPGAGAEGAVLDPQLVKLVPPYVPDPTAAARAFVAYAWPRDEAELDEHYLPVMAITEKGLVYWSLPVLKPYVGKRRPVPLACFADKSTLGAEPGRVGRDGLTWISIEESRPWFDPNVFP